MLLFHEEKKDFKNLMPVSIVFKVSYESLHKFFQGRKILLITFVLNNIKENVLDNFFYNFYLVTRETHLQDNRHL